MKEPAEANKTNVPASLIEKLEKAADFFLEVAEGKPKKSLPAGIFEIKEAYPGLTPGLQPEGDDLLLSYHIALHRAGAPPKVIKGCAPIHGALDPFLLPELPGKVDAAIAGAMQGLRAKTLSLLHQLKEEGGKQVPKLETHES